jgi:hypothetical protein
MTDRDDIYDAIDRERAHQREKWLDRPHEIGAWLTVLRLEIAEGERAWVKGRDEDALREILQVAAVCIAALEQHGIREREIPEKNCTAEVAERVEFQ